MQKIEVQFVLEMLGRPQEYVTEAVNSIVEKLSKEKGIKILEKTIHPPIPLKDSKDLFTSFVEITAELDSFASYFGIIFGYFPAHIEIVSPPSIEMQASYINEIGTALVQRLHEYDALAKKLVYEKEILTNRLKEFAPHLFVPQEASSIKIEEVIPQKGQSDEQIKGKTKSNKKSSKPAKKSTSKKLK